MTLVGSADFVEFAFSAPLWLISCDPVVPLAFLVFGPPLSLAVDHVGCQFLVLLVVLCLWFRGCPIACPHLLPLIMLVWGRALISFNFS